MSEFTIITILKVVACICLTILCALLILSAQFLMALVLAIVGLAIIFEVKNFFD